MAMIKATRRSGAECRIDLSQRRTWHIDVSVTAASVAMSARGKKRTVRWGGTITAGLVVYEDRSDNGDAKAAHCETSAATAAVAGIALNAGADGQPGEICYYDPAFVVGGTVVVGTTYVLSASGLIAPIGDLAAADYVTVLGVGVSATAIFLNPIASGVQVPA